MSNSEKDRGTRPKKQRHSPKSKDRSVSPKKKDRRAELPQIRERHHKRWYQETGKKLVSKKHTLRDDLGIFSKILKRDDSRGGTISKLNGLIFLHDPDFSSGHKVSFGTIEFRNYAAMPSLNPSVTSGPAVQLGWNCNKEELLDLDYYENCRTEWLESIKKTSDQVFNELRLNDLVRLERLRDAGYNFIDINNVINQTNELRIEREKSLKAYVRWTMMTKHLKRYYRKLFCKSLKSVEGATVV